MLNSACLPFQSHLSKIVASKYAKLQVTLNGIPYSFGNESEAKP
jgi:hypothetical protein